MSEIAKSYYNSLINLMSSIKVTDKDSNVLDFYSGIDAVCNLIMSQAKSGHKVMFIGNGGSAAISSHMSTDFWKNGGVKATAFNDSSLLTCISNDFGYKHVFEKPIEAFADAGDVLFSISSSGLSENILQGVRIARKKGCKVVTLSGFNSDNPLFSTGDFNFYVPAQSYGLVEIMHHSICHCILNTINQNRHK